VTRSGGEAKTEDNAEERAAAEKPTG
jgi:hypothetical protein